MARERGRAKENAKKFGINLLSNVVKSSVVKEDEKDNKFLEFLKNNAMKIAGISLAVVTVIGLGYKFLTKKSR